MDKGQLLTSAQVGELLGISEEDARMAMRRHAGPGTIRTNDRRWFMPAERLDDLRQALHKPLDHVVDHEDIGLGVLDRSLGMRPW